MSKLFILKKRNRSSSPKTAIIKWVDKVKSLRTEKAPMRYTIFFSADCFLNYIYHLIEILLNSYLYLAVFYLKKMNQMTIITLMRAFHC